MERICRAYTCNGRTVTTNAGSLEASHEAAEWKFDKLPKVGGWVQRVGTNQFFWHSNPSLFADIMTAK